LRILSIVSTAYRATIEEQDDAALWLLLAMVKEGGQISLLLRGNAVNYALRRRAANTVPVVDLGIVSDGLPQLEIQRALSMGVDCFCVAEDVVQRGLDASLLWPGIQILEQAAVPELVERFDAVWSW
jgi:hypothetical protein